MQAKQSLGQNFLMHQATADRIANAAGDLSDMTVLEIGPGTGMLTRSLLEKAGKVIAIETDRELIPELKLRFAQEIGLEKLVLIEGDIRTFDLAHMPTPYVVVANIPYYITGEIIRILLSASQKPQSVTLLVQKEVAQRVVRSKKESLLSLSVKVYGVPTYAFTVPRGAFRPSPKVDSAVLHIKDIHTPFANTEEEILFFKVIHAGFAHKRKRLAKNLESLARNVIILEACTSLGIDKNARSEDVPLETWLALANYLANEKK